MRIKTGVAMTALLPMHTASLAAQKAGAIELGAFGRYSWFDKALNFDSRGPGGLPPGGADEDELGQALQ